MVLTMTLATLALGGTRIRDELGQALAGLRRPHRWWLPLVGHVIALAILTWLTALVMETDLRSSAHPDRLAIAWMAVAAVTLALWAAAALPPSVWLAQVRRNWGLLAGGRRSGSPLGGQVG